MKKQLIKKAMDVINYSLKVDANSTSTAVAYQPKAPAKLQQFKVSKNK